MLLLLKNYGLAPAFRFKSSVLLVATRHFMTASPTQYPALAQKKAPLAQKKAEKPKPKRILKKDITPPFKKPMGYFVKYAFHRLKERDSSLPPVKYTAWIQECSGGWQKLSEEEKKSYAPSPEALEKYKADYAKWYEGLSAELKSALRVRRRKENGTGYALYVSENYKNSEGNTMLEKIVNLSRSWKLVPDDEKKAYSERAATTTFGVRARRAAVLHRRMDQKRVSAEKAKEKKIAMRERAMKATQERKMKVREKKKAMQIKKLLKKRIGTLDKSSKKLKEEMKRKVLRERKASKDRRERMALVKKVMQDMEETERKLAAKKKASIKAKKSSTKSKA